MDIYRYTMMEDDYMMIIKNEKVYNYYKLHSEYNFEEVSLLAIDLIENWKLKSTKDDVIEIIKETTQEQNKDLQKNIEMHVDIRSNTLTNDIKEGLSRELLRLDGMRDVQQNLMLSKLGNMEGTIKDCSEFLGNYQKSSVKGQLGENYLQKVLNEMYPSAEVLNTTGTPHSCDFKLDRNNGSDIILFETKEYGSNVSVAEVEKFKRDIDTQKQHGVFLSQKSGITTKSNFQFDFKGGNILVYVHNVGYNSDLIHIAVNLIDSISLKLKEIDNDILENNISSETMKEINKEYQEIIIKKKRLIDNLNNFNKTMKEDIDSLNMPCILGILRSKFDIENLNKNEDLFSCEICNIYTSRSKRGLTVHKKSCKIKKNTRT